MSAHIQAAEYPSRERQAAAPVFLNRPTACILLAALTVYMLTRALVPALARVDTDFPNYLTAAKLVANGRDVSRLYDDSWFREQMGGYGMAPTGKFAPFPPPTALLLVPLASVEPLTALRVMTAVSLLSLLASVWLLARVLSWSTLDAAVLVLLSGQALVADLRFGQPYILISALCLAGYYAWRGGRPWLAGICFGLFVPVKYYPLIFLAVFAWRREWRVVLGGAAASGAVTLLGIAVLGWPLHATFLQSVLGNHLSGNLSGQDPFAASFQSFDTLFRRLFVLDASENPHPLWNAPWLRAPVLLVTKAALVLLAALAWMKLARRPGTSGIPPAIGILGLLTLLVAPATAAYHFVLAWLPVGLLVDYFLRARARAIAYLVLGAYALIGYFPYRFTVPFEGDGGLTLLAYPRLLLLLATFLLCASAIVASSQLRVPDE